MLEFLYFIIKCAMLVLFGKFFFDTVQVFIKCKFKHKDNEEEEEE